LFSLVYIFLLLPASFFFFFFQAEDGIRDFHVTGVQTCALPILAEEAPHRLRPQGRWPSRCHGVLSFFPGLVRKLPAQPNCNCSCSGSTTRLAGAACASCALFRRRFRRIIKQTKAI